MADEKKSSTLILILLGVFVLWFLVNRSITQATKTVSGVGAKNVGYGIGAGAVAQGASSIGSFLGGLFSSGSNSKPGSLSGGGSPYNTGSTSSSFGHDEVFNDQTYDDRILDSQSDSVAFVDNDV